LRIHLDQARAFKLSSLRATRFKHNHAEIEFSEAIERLKKLDAPTKSAETDTERGDLEEQYLELSKLAEVSPWAAVLKAWVSV
jgi:hypothetical protein